MKTLRSLRTFGIRISMSVRLRNCRLLTLAASAAAFSIVGCGSEVADKPIARFQIDLLELAFDSASLIPSPPHENDRARAQEAVVLACLKLDQPARALAYASRIETFRRGTSHAEIAFHLIENGNPRAAKAPLQLAEEAADRAEDWRKDRIRMKVARAYERMGKSSRAGEIESKVTESSEIGKSLGVTGEDEDDGAFDGRLREIDALIDRENFDSLRNGLEACAQLYRRHYADEKRRAMLEERLDRGLLRIGGSPRLDLLSQSIEAALAHGDRSKAFSLMDEAQTYIDENPWPPEDRLRLTGEFAELRFRAGDAEWARADCAEALERFEAEKPKIINMFRPEALHFLAGAYATMGDAEAALSVYRTAVEEGVENPNSRPRAEDLAGSCVSMAVNAVEPDAKLWNRLRQIHKGLGPPW